MDDDHLGLAAGQQLVQPARAVAPHRVVDHAQPRVLDALHIHQLADAGQVGRLGVEGAQQPHGLGLLGRDASHTVHAGRDQALDLLEPVGIDGAARMGRAP